MPFEPHAMIHLTSIAHTMKLLLTGYDESPKQYQNYQYDNLKMMCRWLEKLMVPLISKAAEEKALELGLNAATLRCSTWFHQKSLMKDPKRNIFHLEHVKPVKQLAKEVLHSRGKTTEEIVQILQTAEIAWILKTEDNKLNASKQRTYRPDPLESYRQCGINLIED